MVKNCGRGLENAARGLRPGAAFSSPRSQFFTIRTDTRLVNNLYIILSLPKIIVIKLTKALPWSEMGKFILR